MEKTGNNQNVKISWAGGGGSSSFSGGGYSSSTSYSSTPTDSGSSSNSQFNSGEFSVWLFVGLLLFWVVATGLILVFLIKFKDKFSGIFDTGDVNSDDPRAKEAGEIFAKYQKDWSNFDLDSMKNYMTAEYFYHNQLMIGAIKLLKRRDEVSNLKVLISSISRDDPENKCFSAKLTIKGKDSIIDSRNGHILYIDEQDRMKVYCNFIKNENDKWLLSSVDAATANPMLQNARIEDFAKKSGYCYSLDWGWLLLPTRGNLFNSGHFGVSDINNHVIGQLPSTGKIKPDDTIFQLYNYIQNPSASSANYLIAQVATEKNYGNILVREKKKFNLRPKKMQKISTEWNDFNRKYEVFASEDEKVAMFELLNPSFMEKIANAKFSINIEVVENTLYFFAKNTKVSAENYAELLHLLQDAYREIRK